MLEDKEKRIILYLSAFLIINLFTYFFLSGKYRESYFSKIKEYSLIRKNFLNLQSKAKITNHELIKWKNALKDINFLRENYFFSTENAEIELRKYLQKGAKNAGISVGEVNYSYGAEKKEKIGVINFSFSIEDDYFKIKKFIRFIEAIPKFIIFKKLDIMGSDSSGKVTARFYLSAYTNEK